MTHEHTQTHTQNCDEGEIEEIFLEYCYEEENDDEIVKLIFE